MGRAISGTFRKDPKSAFTVDTANDAYLKSPSRERLKTTARARTPPLALSCSCHAPIHLPKAKFRTAEHRSKRT